MINIRYLYYLGLLFLTASCAAKSERHLDCDWTIPSGYHQVDKKDYRNVAENDSANWKARSVVFSDYSISDNTYNLMNEKANYDVLMLQHKLHESDSFKYISLFVRSEGFGMAVMISQLWIIDNEQAVYITDLSKKDAMTLTSGCAEFSQIEQHYDVLKQVQDGFSEFLQTDHGMAVLVPKAE